MGQDMMRSYRRLPVGQCIVRRPYFWLPCVHLCFTERHDAIRLISARPVTRLERQDYENQ